VPNAGLGYWQGRLDRVEIKTYFGLTFFTAHVGYEKAYQDPSYDYEGNMITVHWLSTRDASISEVKAQNLANFVEGDETRFYKLGVF
jgi:carbamoylphosphate synthase small subunit